jgi:transmembrane protein EpsG
MGTDYDHAFDEVLPIMDRGFNLLMIFFNNCGFEPQSIIIFCSYVIFGIFLYAMYKYSTDLPFSLFLLFFLSYYTMINGIRQVLAAAIMLLALPFLRDKKLLLYAPFVLLAYTMHASAIVMLPLYFVLTRKRFNIGIWVFYGVVSLFFVLPDLANRLLGGLLEDSTYYEYLNITETMGVMRLLVGAVPLVITALYHKATAYDLVPDADSPDYKQHQLVTLLINMQFVSFGFTILGLRMVYFARISIFFEFVNALLLPIVIKKGFHPSSARFIKHAAIVLYFAYFLYQTYTFYNYRYFHDFRLVF